MGRQPITGCQVQKWDSIDDVDKLIVELMASKESLIELLQKQEMKDKIIVRLVSIFSKICNSRIRQSMIALLVLLRDSSMIVKHIPNYMILSSTRHNSDEQNIEFAENLARIITEYFKCFPTSFHDMPLDSLHMFATKLKSSEDVVKKVQELTSNREAILHDIAEKKSNIKKEETPSQSFREMEVHPTEKEIHLRERPFLRAIKKRGCYNDGEHYLDVQYRLLKEDLISPLREGIHEVIDNIPRRERKHALKVYTGIKVLYTNCTNQGLTYHIAFDTTYTKGIPWKHSKRLIYGSLLCFSKDNFQTMIFATVANRDAEGLANGELDIRFIERQSSYDYVKDGEQMSMVESASYFEAYKHVLKALKEIPSDAVPMSCYIVECKSNVEIPMYLKQHKNPVYELPIQSNNQQQNIKKPFVSKFIPIELLEAERRFAKVEIMEDSSWDIETCLNKSQVTAYKNALTNELSVIQGPPGTGKTHVGLRIADTFLINKSFWNKGENTPMLIVCYTNHALDQFLHGLVEFGHKNIIRVGGRASESLKKYSLSEATFRIGRDTIIRQAKINAYEMRDNIKRQLQPYVDGLKQLNTSTSTGLFLHFDTLQHVISPTHINYFGSVERNCRQLGISVFDIFLGLLKIPPENVRRIQRIKVQEDMTDKKGNDFINVEGEGDNLVNRWAADREMFANEGTEKDTKEAYASLLVDKDGFQVVQPTKKERQSRIKENLGVEALKDNEVKRIVNPWRLSLKNRWKLYKYWIRIFTSQYSAYVQGKTEDYENACERVAEICEQEEERVLRQADVIAMTTTCAAKYQRIMNKIKPKVVIIEEAAEVLEAHVMSSLTDGTQHLVLIGDHKQLRPNPSVIELAKKFSLEVSLFERMVNNGIQCHMLDTQHRMRPEISKLLRHVYPTLKDHESVMQYPDIKGISKNIVFINHQHVEGEIEHLKSKCNLHEARFIKSLCRYFLKQGYASSQITILTGYTGQLLTLQNMMPRSEFEGVRVAAVDNFQGEENEIILLSLVRSNLDGKIGFLRTNNRVCVALSRAKHGLYVIGNFQALEEASLLWQKIISDIRAMNALQDHVTLICRNHPETKVNAKEETDFFQVPEGGCTKPCAFRLSCGHACAMACHPTDQDHANYVCRKSCNKTVCADNHKCPKACHNPRPCGKCTFKVSKIVPKCGHKQIMKCFEEPKDFICQEKCTKVFSCGHICAHHCGEDCAQFECKVIVKKKLKCGHEASVECHLDSENVVCSEPCDATLECLHKCTGTCGTCIQGRLHVKCLHECKRILVCSHLCEEPCTDLCPPCLKKCENKCVHSNCQECCGKPCVLCTEPCAWKCEHQQCTALCSELCNRDRCNEPCSELLDCGHACIGLCGEKCPDYCRICNKEIVEEIFFGTESDKDARFIVLEDCYHIFEVSSLDTWMEIQEEANNIKLKECPKCKTVVRKSLRYGNIVRQTLNDIEAIKRKMIGEKNEIEQKKRKANRLWMKIRSLSSFFFMYTMGGSTKSLPKLIEKSSDIYTASSLLNQVKLIKNLVNFLTEQELKDQKADAEISLLGYLINSPLREQQFKLAIIEFERLKLIHSAKDTLERLQIKNRGSYANVVHNAALLDDIGRLSEWLAELRGKFLSDAKLKVMSTEITTVQKKWNTHSVTVEEKETILKAMGLEKGRWFKCENGHYYAIGECGGAMEKSKCPECNCVIGGENHALATGNQHAGEFDDSAYAAYSEEANNLMNLDPQELERLRR
ncbi:NFX1-type zinc finger-containing protein 1-like isoform X2 [Hydractinia symbiolongicarpus]|nr:NFX1-type zinc finger-containing protein 1-like isoform X2 [Hydractinia symbiolongicarpus]